MEALCTSTACWTTQHLTRGHAGRKPYVACRSAWLGENRLRHPELPRGLSINGHEGRWEAVRGAPQLAARVQRGIPGPEPASYVTTGVYGTFELMSRASSFLLCSLFFDVLDLPQGNSDFPQPREWKAASDRYRTLFAAYASNCCISCSDSEPKVLHRAPRPRLSGRSRRRI